MLGVEFANDGLVYFSAMNIEQNDPKAILYRLASWPNLTQLTFMYSIPFGGAAWLNACEAQWPMQNTPMYHYGIASAMGYALSMFSETLRGKRPSAQRIATPSPVSRARRARLLV